MDIHTGDEGQRYECSFDEGDGNRMVMGWANTLDGVNRFRESVKLHPVWTNFEVKDRKGNDD